MGGVPKIPVPDPVRLPRVTDPCPLICKAPVAVLVKDPKLTLAVPEIDTEPVPDPVKAPRVTLPVPVIVLPKTPVPDPVRLPRVTDPVPEIDKVAFDTPVKDPRVIDPTPVIEDTPKVAIGNIPNSI
jgi:hypothetical protein